jgi:hypothetical protein
MEKSTHITSNDKAMHYVGSQDITGLALFSRFKNTLARLGYKHNDMYEINAYALAQEFMAMFMAPELIENDLTAYYTSHFSKLQNPRKLGSAILEGYDQEKIKKETLNLLDKELRIFRETQKATIENTNLLFHASSFKELCQFIVLYKEARAQKKDFNPVTNADLVTEFISKHPQYKNDADILVKTLNGHDILTGAFFKLLEQLNGINKQVSIVNSGDWIEYFIGPQDLTFAQVTPTLSSLKTSTSDLQREVHLDFLLKAGDLSVLNGTDVITMGDCTFVHG